MSLMTRSSSMKTLTRWTTTRTRTTTASHHSLEHPSGPGRWGFFCVDTDSGTRYVVFPDPRRTRRS